MRHNTLSLTINGRASFAAVFSANLVTAGAVFTNIAFATGPPIVVAVNLVTAHVPLAAELTTRAAGFGCEDLSRSGRCAMAVAARKAIRHKGDARYFRFFMVDLEKEVRRPRE